MLEVVVGSLIMLILMVPALQGLSAAYGSYREVQHEQQLLEYTQLVAAYYAELLHAETQTIDAATVTNLASSFTVDLADADTSDFAYTNIYIGPPTNAASFTSVYYVNPTAAAISATEQRYLVAFSTNLTSFSTPVLRTAMILAAYYDAQ